MMTPRLLTIKGVTMSMAAWARQPGAATYNTIADRVIRLHWEDERAVFTTAEQGIRERSSRSRFPKRPHLVPRSIPPAPSALRPRVGSVKSYPIELLDILRRVA